MFELETTGKELLGAKGSRGTGGGADTESLNGEWLRLELKPVYSSRAIQSAPDEKARVPFTYRFEFGRKG